MMRAEHESHECRFGQKNQNGRWSHVWRQGLRWSMVVFAISVLAGQDVSAQETVSGGAHSAAVEFNISAQPLGSALNAFGEATGWQVSVPTELVAGLTSSGISGKHRPEDALQALLIGTGLTYRMTGTNAV